MEKSEYRNAKENITRDLKRYQVMIELLDSIGTAFQDDGEHFPEIERNFTNCLVTHPNYKSEDYEKELFLCKLFTDFGPVDVTVKLYSPEEKRPLTFDEVMVNINLMKAVYKAHVNSCKDELEHFDKYWKSAESAVNQFFFRWEKLFSQSPHIASALSKEVEAKIFEEKVLEEINHDG